MTSNIKMLSDICYYADGRTAVANLDLDTYISTENMLPNKEGITRSAGLPTVSQVQAYQAEDVLVSNIRPYFRKIWFADHDGGCSNDVLVLRTKENCIPGFLYYLLSDDTFFDYATSTAKGTKMPRGDKEALLRYAVPNLPFDIQIGISNILTALDARITINKKINHHLEQMAQTIFKSWFVDFEPFADGGIFKSELGEIPTGWSVATLDDVCSKITDGSHFSPKDSADGTYPMLSVRDMDSFGFNYQSCKLINDNDYSVMVSNDCVPLVDDILVAKDGSYLKHIFIVNEQRKEAILSSIAIFRPNPEVICPELLLCLLKYPATQKTIKDNFVSGSALPRIVLKDFKKLKLVLPPIEVQLRISDLLSGMRKQIAKNQAENASLMSIRDSILPRLMSGELSVVDPGDAK